MATSIKLNVPDEVASPPMLIDAICVRQFESADRADVLRLYTDAPAHTDPSAETIETMVHLIDEAQAGGHRLWVAVAEGRLIGSVALVRAGPELAHLRAMNVDPRVAEHDRVARRLGEAAVVDAWERGYLKLLVHTSRSGVELSGPFHRVSFELSKERWIDGDHVLEFYQNIYARPSSVLPAGENVEH